ncbi:MAG: hypothetical protein JKY03_07520, partial [Aureispira sp.]|nr:hypothetical protein [Aureispira sp.]
MTGLSNSILLLLSLSVVVFMSSCSGVKEVTEKTGSKSENLFIASTAYNKDENYSSIKGGIKRLYAMMSGRF